MSKMSVGKDSPKKTRTESYYTYLVIPPGSPGIDDFLIPEWNQTGVIPSFDVSDAEDYKIYIMNDFLNETSIEVEFKMYLSPQPLPEPTLANNSLICKIPAPPDVRFNYEIAADMTFKVFPDCLGYSKLPARAINVAIRANPDKELTVQIGLVKQV